MTLPGTSCVGHWHRYSSRASTCALRTSQSAGRGLLRPLVLLQGIAILQVGNSKTRPPWHINKSPLDCPYLLFFDPGLGPGFAPPLPFNRLSADVPLEGVFFEGAFPRPLLFAMAGG